MPVNWMIRAGVVEMFNAEGGWVEGTQRSSFSRVILQRKSKVLGGSGQNGVWGRLGFGQPTSHPAALSLMMPFPDNTLSLQGAVGAEVQGCGGDLV